MVWLPSASQLSVNKMRSLPLVQLFLLFLQLKGSKRSEQSKTQLSSLPFPLVHLHLCMHRHLPNGIFVLLLLAKNEQVTSVVNIVY